MRITIRILSVVKTFREGNRSPFSIFLANYLHNRQFIAIFVKILAYRKDAYFFCLADSWSSTVRAYGLKMF